jgi:hypothetical protein
MFEAKFSPAAERNKDAILAELCKVLPANGEVLEIASGTGQHILHFAEALPDLRWQPSEPDAAYRVPLAQLVGGCALSNVRAPIDLDVLNSWPKISVDAVIVANMLHISAEATMRGIFKGAASVMPISGIMHIYGPFKVGGDFTSPSNKEFDQSLRARNLLWGIRDLEELTLVAIEHGFQCVTITPMPANNFSLVYKKTSE